MHLPSVLQSQGLWSLKGLPPFLQLICKPERLSEQALRETEASR